MQPTQRQVTIRRQQPFQLCCFRDKPFNPMQVGQRLNFLRQSYP